MSDSDGFIEEVNEEVRRDRLFGYMRRYGWIAVTAVVLLVGGAAYVEWTRASERAEARAFGDAILSALDAPDAAARRAALSDIDAQGPRRALIAMLAADDLSDAAARAETARTLDTLAADAAMPQLYRDLAALKAAMLAQGVEEPQSVFDRLEPLVVPGAPFRHLALEQQALARIAMDERDAALEILRAILADGNATRDLQGRVRQLIVALGGSLADA